MDNYEQNLLKHIEKLKFLNNYILNKFNNLPFHKMTLQKIPDENKLIALIIEDNFLEPIQKIFKSKIFNKIKRMKNKTFTINYDNSQKIFVINLKMIDEDLIVLRSLINEYGEKVYAHSVLTLREELNNHMTMSIINSIMKKQNFGQYNTESNELTIKKWLKFDFIPHIIDHFLNVNIPYTIYYTKNNCILQTKDSKGIEYIESFLQIELLKYTDFDELKFFIVSKGMLSV